MSVELDRGKRFLTDDGGRRRCCRYIITIKQKELQEQREREGGGIIDPLAADIIRTHGD